MHRVLRAVTVFLALTSVPAVTQAGPLQPAIVGGERYFERPWPPVTRDTARKTNGKMVGYH